MRRALVFGGSGAVGREVVRRLCDSGVEVAFTYHTSGDVAATLAEQTGSTGVHLDLRDADVLRTTLTELAGGVDIFIHCAVVAIDRDYHDLTADDLDEMFAVNVRAPALAVGILGPRMESGGDVVLAGALDRHQSLPIPAGFAATQGALAAYAMAAAKEARGQLRINVVAVGLLDAGLSEKLDPALVADYQAFSALRRLGTPGDVAHTITWLALHNTYMNGKVVSVNGGI